MEDSKGTAVMSQQLSDPFLTEYSSENAVRRYAKKTAGYGINYLLEHEYGEIYRTALRKYLSAPVGKGLKFLEFGCGAGMNLIHCLSIFQQEGIPLEVAYGTDFSERLIEAARNEMSNHRIPEQAHKVQFLVARNERLMCDMTSAYGISRPALFGSLHLIMGVNTFRYCYRMNGEDQCAEDIYDLLMPGGICIMIDMNRKFPAFRSRVRDWFTKPESERYLPSLDEYASSFRSKGFEILECRNTCWIPHSAGPTLVSICRTLTPMLNWLLPNFAMRSLVISRKPS